MNPGRLLFNGNAFRWCVGGAFHFGAPVGCWEDLSTRTWRRLLRRPPRPRPRPPRRRNRRASIYFLNTLYLDQEKRPAAGDGALPTCKTPLSPERPSPQILFQFPQKTSPETISPSTFASFCFQDETEKDRRGLSRHVAQFFTFVITLVDGTRVYGFCLKALAQGVHQRYDVSRRSKCTACQQGALRLGAHAFGLLACAKAADPAQGPLLAGSAERVPVTALLCRKKYIFGGARTNFT